MRSFGTMSVSTRLLTGSLTTQDSEISSGIFSIPPRRFFFALVVKGLTHKVYIYSVISFYLVSVYFTTLGGDCIHGLDLYFILCSLSKEIILRGKP